MELRDLKKADRMQTNGTHFIGAVDVSFAELCKLLGRPHEMGENLPYDETREKVRCEWAFTTGRRLRKEDCPSWAPCDENGEVTEVVTVYDWKEAQPIGMVRDWHVGGFSRETFRVFFNAFNAARAAREETKG